MAHQRRATLRQRLSDHLLQHGFAAFTLEDLARDLRCSKSTLYQLAPSKTELVVGVTRAYFKEATENVEAKVPPPGSPGRVTAYLSAVAEELSPLSRRFLLDVADFAPAREVYERNTTAAAHRVRELVAAGVEAGEFRSVHADFVADVVTQTMFDIVRGGVQERIEMSDSQAYAELTSLVEHALRD